MPEEKADEMEKPDVLLCAHCDEQVTEEKHHLREDESWICIEPNWRERAKKAEAELTACYNEIFWTVPESMPLIEKIKTMHGLEADALLRGADTAKKLEAVQKELDELKGKKPKAKEPKMEPIDPDLGDHMSWADFLQHVEDGGINDDDGSAELATETHVSNVSVGCVSAKTIKKPEWATHVVWYNK
jgi:hypothetical protein